MFFCRMTVTGPAIFRYLFSVFFPGAAFEQRLPVHPPGKGILFLCGFASVVVLVGLGKGLHSLVEIYPH